MRSVQAYQEVYTLIDVVKQSSTALTQVPIPTFEEDLWHGESIFLDCMLDLNQRALLI